MAGISKMSLRLITRGMAKNSIFIDNFRDMP